MILFARNEASENQEVSSSSPSQLFKLQLSIIVGGDHPNPLSAEGHIIQTADLINDMSLLTPEQLDKNC